MMVKSPSVDTFTRRRFFHMDTTFQLTLGVANAIVAMLNAMAFVGSRDRRDVVAAVAWVGSMAYWFWRASIS
jgi:hypothetical protein